MSSKADLLDDLDRAEQDISDLVEALQSARDAFQNLDPESDSFDSDVESACSDIDSALEPYEDSSDEGDGDGS
jgi:uncharacterized phage infection (PIP) family protein YhgE